MPLPESEPWDLIPCGRCKGTGFVPLRDWISDLLENPTPENARFLCAGCYGLGVVSSYCEPDSPNGWILPHKEPGMISGSFSYYYEPPRSWFVFLPEHEAESQQREILSAFASTLPGPMRELLRAFYYAYSYALDSLAAHLTGKILDKKRKVEDSDSMPGIADRVRKGEER